MKLKTERSCRVTAFSFAASVLCSTAMGAVYDASTGYVTMTKSDNAPWPAGNGQAFKSFDADGALETAWGVIGHRWSDGEYTHSGTNYYAQYNMYAHGVSGTPVPFKGDSLIVGAKLTYSGSSGMKMAFNDRTVFGAGASFLWSSVGHVLGGAVTLEGTDERPNRFEHTRRSSGEFTVQFTPALKGAGKAEFKYTDDTVANSINTSVNIKDATWSGFSGKMSILHRIPFISESSAFDFPGTLHLEDTTWTFNKSNGHHTFGTLELSRNSTLVYGSGSTDVTVADRLVLEEGAKIRTKKVSACTMSPATNKFLTLGANAVAAGIPDIKGALALEPLAVTHGPLPRLVVLTDETESGARDFYVTSKPVVAITNNMILAQTPFAWGVSQRDEDNPARFLEDGLPFHDGVDYLVCDRNVIVVSRNDDKSLNSSNDQYAFPGDSLVLERSNLGLYHGCRFAELALCNGTKLRPMGGNGSTAASYAKKTYPINGSLTVAGTVTIACGDNATWKFNAGLSGAGTLVAKLDPESSKGTGNVRGWVELAGDNAAFAGRIEVNESPAGSFADRFSGVDPYESGPSSNITLIVHGSASLGGDLPEMTADAVKIGNNNRIAFAETAQFNARNRGIQLDGNVYFQTASDEVVVTVNNTITWGAKLTKENQGTVVFGAKPEFASSGSRPTLVVEDGFVGVADASALEGVDVEIKSGAGLYIDANAAGEVREKGIVATGGMQIADRVKLRIANVPEEADVKIAVLTAQTATAASVKDALRAERVAGHYVKYSLEPNGDGTATLFANAVRPGFILSVR